MEEFPTSMYLHEKRRLVGPSHQISPQENGVANLHTRGWQPCRYHLHETRSQQAGPSQKLVSNGSCQCTSKHMQTNPRSAVGAKILLCE